MNRHELAQMIDHTLLKPEATAAEVSLLVDSALALGVYAVCVSPSQLPIDAKGLKVAAVCGFPSGAHTSAVKALEAKLAAEQGANEIDMVMNLGAAKAGDWQLVHSDIAAVREVLAPTVVLKVIVESAALSDGELVRACQTAEAAGADFVKTSTGFHPLGGATPKAVALMRKTVGERLGVKASGGIRTLDSAEQMVLAGATRLGLSASATILAQMD